jgi:hypothetical protein
VTVADARFAKPIDSGLVDPAGGRARAARHGRGGRAGRRLWQRGLGDAQRRRRCTDAGSFASACPTATSRTARRSCCTRRSATPPERIAERVRAAIAVTAPRSREEAAADGAVAGARPRKPGRLPARERGGKGGGGASAKRRLDALLAERGLFESRTRAAASVLAGEVRIGPGAAPAYKPGQLVAADIEMWSRSRRGSSPGAGSSWPTRWRRAGSRSKAATRSTWALRRAGSPTACSRRGAARRRARRRLRRAELEVCAAIRG